MKMKHLQVKQMEKAAMVDTIGGLWHCSENYTLFYHYLIVKSHALYISTYIGN